MTRNGGRRPPTPGMELLAEAASETEAAAIAAALERFLVDTARPTTRRDPDQSPWQRAALWEGVSRSEGLARKARSE